MSITIRGLRKRAIFQPPVLAAHVLGSVVQTMLAVGAVAGVAVLAGSRPAAGVGGWFAEHQPFTPVIETVRGLLMGTPVGGHLAAALAWTAGIAVTAQIWAVRRHRRS